MSVIQYFLPNVTAEDLVNKDKEVCRETLVRFGLLKALRDIEQSPRDAVFTAVSEEPGSSGGMLLTPNRVDAVDGDYCYRADSQLWVESINGRFWLGAKADEKIEPVHVLRRGNGYSGYVQRVDDAKWVIPIARSMEAKNITLPQDIVYTCDPTTSEIKTARVPRPEFDEFFQIAGEIVGHASGDDDSKAADADWLNASAVSALSLNYRLWFDEINLAQKLGHSIVRSDNAENICALIADLPLYNEYMAKKKMESDQAQQDSASASTGSEAG